MGGGISFFPHPSQFFPQAARVICNNDKTFLFINSNLFYDLPPFFSHIQLVQPYVELPPFAKSVTSLFFTGEDRFQFQYYCFS